MHKKNRHFMRGRLINYIDLFVILVYNRLVDVFRHGKTENSVKAGRFGALSKSLIWVTAPMR